MTALRTSANDLKSSVIATADAPYDAVMADINNDGLLDLIAADSSAIALRVRAGSCTS